MQRVSHLVLGASFLAMGVLGATGASKFVFLDKGLPGPGFFPMTLSVAVIALSVLVLIPAIKSAGETIDAAALTSAGQFFTLLTATSAIVTELAGLIPGLGLFYVIALRRWNAMPLRNALANGVVSMAALYAVFVLWLGVDMPWGVFRFLFI